MPTLFDTSADCMRIPDALDFEAEFAAVPISYMLQRVK
jgi:hypothetical protein